MVAVVAVIAMILAILIPLWDINEILRNCIGYLVNSGITPLHVNAFIACVGLFVANAFIPALGPMFIRAGLSGRDLNKPNKNILQESSGVIVGAIYLMCMFVFIPIPYIWDQFHGEFAAYTPIDTRSLTEFLSALLSICCMIFLGFADDVLNLKWRYKLVLPTAASLPVLMVYIANAGSTVIMVPKPMVELLNIGDSLDLGLLYYIFIGMLSVFCTNCINILAGINGVEAGQSFVIGLSVLVNNAIQIWRSESNSANMANHLFSAYLVLPFLTTTVALLRWNWCPARVFVGDTYCYLAGITMATAAIHGHFIKTLLLFFMPQVFNFIYSAPQLFRLLPCPRHRMPAFNEKTGKLFMSFCSVPHEEVTVVAKVLLSTLSDIGLLHVRRSEKNVEFNNLTLLNLLLKFAGPTNEGTLTIYMLILQCFSSVLAFIIRYKLVFLFYTNI